MKALKDRTKPYKPPEITQPKIIAISAIPMVAPPTDEQPARQVIATIGLADDSKIYQWDGGHKRWVPA